MHPLHRFLERGEKLTGTSLSSCEQESVEAADDIERRGHERVARPAVGVNVANVVHPRYVNFLAATS
jgi:hypothetical protein